MRNDRGPGTIRRGLGERAEIIGFDDVPAGTIVSNQYHDLGIDLSDEGLAVRTVPQGQPASGTQVLDISKGGETGQRPPFSSADCCRAYATRDDAAMPSLRAQDQEPGDNRNGRIDIALAATEASSTSTT